jgi:hypothetical protein
MKHACYMHVDINGTCTWHMPRLMHVITWIMHVTCMFNTCTRFRIGITQRHDNFESDNPRSSKLMKMALVTNLNLYKASLYMCNDIVHVIPIQWWSRTWLRPAGQESGATNTDQSHDTPRHKGNLNSDFRLLVNYMPLTCGNCRMVL